MQDTVLVKNSDLRKSLSDLQSINDELLTLAAATTISLLPPLRYIAGLDCIPQHWCQLFKDIASASPVSAYAPSAATLGQTLTDMETKTRVTPTTMRQLQAESPVLFAFFSHASHVEAALVVNVLKDLLAVKLRLESFVPHALNVQSEASQPTSSVLECYPALTIHHRRGIYRLDKEKDGEECTKRTKVQKSLLPGIFLVYCEHGKQM